MLLCFFFVNRINVLNKIIAFVTIDSNHYFYYLFLALKKHKNQILNLILKKYAYE